MSLLETKIKNFFCSTSNFRLTFVFNLLLQSLVILDALCCLVDIILLLWFIFLFKRERLDRKTLLKIDYVILPFLFIFFSFITSLINMKINFPLNFLFDLGMIVYSGACFFMFYGMQADYSKESFQKETTKIFKLIAFANTLFVFISLVLILIKKQIVIEGNLFGNAFKYIIGVHKVFSAQRFTGIYENPNILAFCSVVSLIFIHMLVIKKEFFKNITKSKRIFLLVVFVSLNFLALILSDSRASFLLLTVYAILNLFNKYSSLNESATLKQKLLNFFIFIFGAAFSVFVLVFLRQGLQENVANIISNISSIFGFNNDLKDLTFGRIDYNIIDGNGRIELLKKALEIFKKNPIFGVGPASAEYFGPINLRNGLSLCNFHNGYVSVLVSSGLLGFLPFFAFLCIITFSLVRSLLNSLGKRNLGIFPGCVCAVFSYFVYALYEKTILSEINIMSVFMWLILGYACAYEKFCLKSGK